MSAFTCFSILCTGLSVATDGKSHQYVPASPRLCGFPFPQVLTKKQELRGVSQCLRQLHVRKMQDARVLSMGLLPQEIGPVVYLGHPGHEGGIGLQTAKETEAAGACCRRHRRGRFASMRSLLNSSSPAAEEDALTRDWGPRRLRHDLQNVGRNLSSLVVAMASGHTGNGSSRAYDPQPK